MDGAATMPQTEPAAVSPPHNTEIEAALIGAVLNNNRAYDKCFFVKPEHFFEPVHGRIWARIASLIDGGQPAEPTALAAEFAQDEALADVGGGQYLFEVAAAVVDVLNPTHYANQIVDWAKKRAGIEAFEQAIEDLLVWEKPFETTANAAETALDVIRGGNGYTQGLRQASDGMRAALDDLDAAMSGKATRAVSTGLIDLDRKVRLRPGRVCTIAGATSMGKSSLIRQIARQAATDGFATVYFSLEETAAEIAMKLACAARDIPYSSVDRAEVSQAEFEDLNNEAQRIETLPLHIDDRSGSTIADMKAECRRIRRQVHQIGLIVVDYLQLMQPGRVYQGNRNNEIGEITRGLMDMAKRFECPVIVGSQLSRESQRRGQQSHRPVLSDLRESGSIEQDSNTVIFIHREEYYAARREPSPMAYDDVTEFQQAHSKWMSKCDEVRGLADLIVAKSRGGETGTVKCRYDGPAMTFHNLATAGQEAMF